MSDAAVLARPADDAGFDGPELLARAGTPEAVGWALRAHHANN
jgi:hypothetical protein